MSALLVFIGSAAVLAYVMVGCPILIGVLARFRARPVNKKPLLKRVSILIAVHNGQSFLRQKLTSIRELDYPRDLIETFVLCDGCTDSSAMIAAEFQEVTVFQLPRAGKPAALNHGISHAQGEILIFTDVRQRLAPDCVRHLVANFADPSVGVVSGELRILAGDTEEEANVGLYWRMESWIRAKLSSIDSMFGATGPIYAMRRDLAVMMPPEILLDDMYQPLSAFFKGYRLIVDTAAKAYDYPTSLETEFRRKVRTLAGNYQLLRFYPALLTPRNRMWLLFLSYKIGRLLLPYALAAMVISSFFLPAPWAAIIIVCESVFVLLAAADRVVPQSVLLKKVSSPARTFLVMMAAALCAVSIFFVPPQRLWKVTTKVGVGKGAA